MDDNSCNLYMLRTECIAYHQYLEQKIASVDRRVDTTEQTSNEIKRELGELRKEFTEGFEAIKEEFKTDVNAIKKASDDNHDKTATKLDNFIESFNKNLYIFFVVAIVMLISVIIGRSVDFGWIIAR